MDIVGGLSPFGWVCVFFFFFGTWVWFLRCIGRVSLGVVLACWADDNGPAREFCKRLESWVCSPRPRCKSHPQMHIYHIDYQLDSMACLHYSSRRSVPRVVYIRRLPIHAVPLHLVDGDLPRCALVQTNVTASHLAEIHFYISLVIELNVSEWFGICRGDWSRLRWYKPTDQKQSASATKAPMSSSWQAQLLHEIECTDYCHRLWLYQCEQLQTW